MSQKGPLPPLLISMTNHVVPDSAPNAPYIPSVVEAANYYYGFPSKPRLVARSSCDVWMRPTGPEAYLVPKGLMPLGSHSLATAWEDIVSPALSRCLDEKGVNFLTMTPARINIVDQPSHPVVVLVGVEPGSLTHELGIEAAVACHSVLIANSILDVHVEIRESKPSLAAALYRPAVTSNPAARLIEPFATSLGLPISFVKTTHYEGTAGFFFTDSAKSGKLFMLTARHVLFHPDETPNTMYVFKDGTGAPQRKVILLGKAAFDARVEDIDVAIRAKKVILAQLAKRAADAAALEDEAEARDETEAVQAEMEKAEKAIAAFEKLRTEILRDWQDEGKRVIGHVVLSPPFTLNFGTDGYTEDWAVVEIHGTMISRLNFIGNAIDLGSVDVDVLTSWMYPDSANPHSFDYPGNRLLRFSGTLSDEEMRRPPLHTKDQDKDAVIMVLKNGNTSGLTVGCLNNVRSVVRHYFKDQPGVASKEVAVLPRTSKSGAFSAPGDSGSAVVDGKGRVCGILTGGDGATDVSDVTFVTSINFLLKRLAENDVKANIFPTVSH
ncbi:hypothetical protein EVJ58_g10202 [Rhodofomes roseus]|uniref:Uncharacterized protein n=1 Tax=Rhodofomes roseus TaxID=34475 RepID=A0A4Y9XPP0_9APHY|nr:hypothetical protein EVJ58_g10202 [Rhodofomes roseus]